MKIYGLIGKSLLHSFSKKYFENKFSTENIIDCKYELFELDTINELEQLIQDTKHLVGLNVTIPYKETVINVVDDIDDKAKEIGAINTIQIDSRTKKTKGYNTDYLGFKNSLKPFLENSHERALILGTGGASKAVAYALRDLNINCLFASRNPKTSEEISYNDVNEYVIKHHQVLINTTPLGTSPNINTFPDLPYQQLTSKHLLYDLVYNPEETLFLKNGKERGCTTINGLQMLKIQAEKSWEIWNS